MQGVFCGAELGHLEGAAKALADLVCARVDADDEYGRVCESARLF